MKIRKALGLILAAALGVATVLLPAAASSETAPSVKAENVGEFTHYWTPPSVTVAEGGAVGFSNPTGVPHGIHWISTPGGTPVCSGSVPVGSGLEHAGTNWSGSCTFAGAGTYTYYCSVHGAAMSGSVTVNAATAPGTTPIVPATTTTSTESTTSGGGRASGGGSTGAQLLALRLSTPRGGSVHGSFTVGTGAAGGTLTVALSARLGGHRVRVGQLTRTYLSAGPQRWSLVLSSRARRALRAKRHLAVTVRIELTPPGGAPTVVTRTVTERA